MKKGWGEKTQGVPQCGASFTLELSEAFLFKLSFTVSFKRQSLCTRVSVKSFKRKGVMLLEIMPRGETPDLV